MSIVKWSDPERRFSRHAFGLKKKRPLKEFNKAKLNEFIKKEIGRVGGRKVFSFATESG